MSPLTEAVTELRLLVAHAEDTTPGVHAEHARLEDYRTAVLGDRSTCWTSWTGDWACG